jgi:chemotaxis signal transduction protein
MVQMGEADGSRPGSAGTVDLHGQVIPVYSVRSFFRIPAHPPRLSDMLIVTQAGPDPVALWADDTRVIPQGPGLLSSAEEEERGEPVAPGVDLIKDGTYLFGDLARFLGAGVTIVPAAPAGDTGPRGEGTAGPEDQEPGSLPFGPLRKILEDRARKIAAPEAGAAEAGIVDVLRFQLAYQEYALEMRYVREVILTGEITPVPGAPPFISGICAARGQIISLVDLRVLLALPEKGLTDLNRVIVITDGNITFGILADNITGIGTIPSFLIVLPDTSMTPPWRQYLKGYVGSLIMLDAASILADPALVVEDT